jgi:hypothetical protein
MGAAAERRALLLETDDSYDPFLTIDINEYLIAEFPTLTAKQRQSVWHLCQNDDSFDYDSIHDQIDNWVFEFAESNPDVILNSDDEDDSGSDNEPYDSDEEENEDYESNVFVNLTSYLQDNYDEIDEDEMHYMVELITWKFDYTEVYSQIDDIITKYSDGDYDEELEDDSDETPTE